MINVREGDGGKTVHAAVTDFVNVMGYCEHKLAPIVEGVEVPTPVAVRRGGAAHVLEEAKDAKDVAERIERGELVEATEEAIADPGTQVELERESVYTTLEMPVSSGGRSASVCLFGRADKVCRVNGALRVIDNKFAANPARYDSRDEPFMDQKLQVLAYLNSSFSTTKARTDSLDIPHESKEWSIQIHDAITREPAKTFLKTQSEHDRRVLAHNVSRFAGIALGWEKPVHHDNPRKCRPCQYIGVCKFALHE